MSYLLENDKLSIIMREKGGELCSIKGKASGTEFLWTGDAAHWAYHAPVLFPTVGKVIDGTYRVDGKEYHLPQHGLARLRDFELTDKSADSLTFTLSADQDTLAVYPWRFSLGHRYQLEGARVIITRTVENTDDQDIYFAIGEHPAFMCPMDQGEAFTDYYFELEQKETCPTMQLKDGYFLKEKKEFLNDDNIIPISYELFKDDALVFDELLSEKITLKSKNHGKSVTVDFKGYPYLALWSKKDAPFVCVEPWYGHSDFEGFEGDFREKAGIIRLAPGKTFSCRMIFTIED